MSGGNAPDGRAPAHSPRAMAALGRSYRNGNTASPELRFRYTPFHSSFGTAELPRPNRSIEQVTAHFLVNPGDELFDALAIVAIVAVALHEPGFFLASFGIQQHKQRHSDRTVTQAQVPQTVGGGAKD